MIVESTLQAARWKGRILDARVDDHPNPVPELRRLVAPVESEANAAALGMDPARPNLHWQVPAEQNSAPGQ